MDVVVYLRTRPSEPEASEAALAAQRTAVASWLAEHGATAVAEFVEGETRGKARPQLGQALAACRRHDAALLMAPVEPAGTGQMIGAKHGSLGGVPSIALAPEAPTSARPETSPDAESEAPLPEPALPPTPIPLPAGAPDRLCLSFDPSSFPKLPVYVCNPGPGAITDVVVTSVGTTTKWTRKVTVGGGDDRREIEVPLQTSTTRKSFEAVEPGTCIQVDRYDVFFDGDFITVYEVAWTDEAGIQHQARAIVGTGGPKARWLALDTTQRNFDALGPSLPG